MQKEPKARISTEEWSWGAKIFAQKGGFMQYSSSFAARIHARDVDLIKKLQDVFGGSTGNVAGTLQWRISGEPLKLFLEGIEAKLGALVKEEYYDPEILELVRHARAQLSKTKIRRKRGAAALQRSSMLREGLELELGGETFPQDRAALPEEGEEAFGRVPPGPWDEELALLDMAADGSVFPKGVLLQAENPQQAVDFAAAVTKLSPLLKAVAFAQWVRLLAAAKPVIPPPVEKRKKERK